MKSLKDKSFLLINLSHFVTITLSLIGAIINVLLFFVPGLGRGTQNCGTVHHIEIWERPVRTNTTSSVFFWSLFFYYLLHHPTTTLPILWQLPWHSYSTTISRHTLISDTCIVTSDWTSFSPDMSIIKLSHLQVFFEMLTFQRGLPWPFLFDTDTWPLPLLLTPSSLTGIIFSFILRTLHLQTLVNVSILFYFCLAH